MKNLTLFLTIIFVVFVSSCGSNETANSPEGILANKLKVVRWGPEDAKVGVVPNKQPDGKMGIWIEVNSTDGIGDIQVLFGGKPMLTAVEPKLITTGVPAQEFSAAGEKKVEIQSLQTGESITVGNFKVTP